MAIIMRALTSNSDVEILESLAMLKASHNDTFFMHETFNVNDATEFTRPWFAWCNSLFGELLMDLAERKPYLLFDPDYTPPPADPEVPPQNSGGNAALIFLGVCAAVGGLALAVFAFRRFRQSAAFKNRQGKSQNYGNENGTNSWNHVNEEDDDPDGAWDADMEIGKGLLPMMESSTAAGPRGASRATVVEL
jgi:hypothetical protein